MRLHASGVCHSDLNAIDGTVATRCPAVLGHEGAGVVEQVGERAWRWRPARASCSRGCRRAGAAPSACAGSATCARTAWRGMATGGLLDGRPRLSRGGEPVYHYSFLSAFAERTVVPAALLRPDPGRRAVRGRRARRLRGRDRHRRGLADGGRAAGRAGGVFGCGGVGMSARAGRASPPAPTRSSRSTWRTTSSRRRRRSGRRMPSSWAGDAEATAERVLAATRRGRRLRVRGDRAARGGAGRVPLHARRAARRC